MYINVFNNAKYFCIFMHSEFQSKKYKILTFTLFTKDCLLNCALTVSFKKNINNCYVQYAIK